MDNYNHYTWLRKYMPIIHERVGLDPSLMGAISAHGDKCYGYENEWKKAGIPFEHGVAIFLLTFWMPSYYLEIVSDYDWDYCKWVIDNYDKFKPIFKDMLPLNSPEFEK